MRSVLVTRDLWLVATSTLIVSSLGVTLGPLIFGRCVETVGGYRGPWVGLALTMIAGLTILAFVRERPRADVFLG